MDNLRTEYDRVKEELEAGFDILFPKDASVQTVIEACLYSLKVGGKRLRPFLLLEFCEICGGDGVKAIPFAHAIEMVHTYSLIHDDLPSMDNDDFRRGRLTNHKVFGEAMAILAGDGLQSYAFEMALSADFSAEILVKATKELAKAIGVYGMVGGQTIDIESERNQKVLTHDELCELHGKKTGALIAAACKIGCILAGADDNTVRAAEAYGYKLGLAFQITDDILDVTSDFQTLGKTPHKDENSNKTTFINLFGVEESQMQAQHYTNDAIKLIEGFPDNGLLTELTKSLLYRLK